MRGCVWLQWILFWRLFRRVCLFHDGWFRSAPAHTTLSVQQAVFDPKRHDPHAPPSLLIPSCQEWLFFAFPGEKSPQRETFSWCGRGETKNSRKINKFRNCFDSGKKCLDKYITSNGEYLLWRGLKFKHIIINTQFFINQFFWVPPCMWLLNKKPNFLPLLYPRNQKYSQGIFHKELALFYRQI